MLFGVCKKHWNEAAAAFSESKGKKNMSPTQVAKSMMHSIILFSSLPNTPWKDTSLISIRFAQF